MVDNFELIKLLLSFTNDDEFYFLQILKRNKENPGLGRNSKVIKSYYINSMDHFCNKTEEIKLLCELHNARCYINLTKRSYEKIAFHNLKKVTDCLMNKDFKSIKTAYDSVCGMYSTGEKYWLVDVDTHDFNIVLNLAQIIKRTESQYDPNVVAFIPTINGWHIITHPFQLNKFDTTIEHDLHKNNPTLLYYNKKE